MIKKTFNTFLELETSVDNLEYQVGDIVASRDDSETYIVLPTSYDVYKLVPVSLGIFQKLKNFTPISISELATGVLSVPVDFSDDLVITSNGLQNPADYQNYNTSYGLKVPSGASCSKYQPNLGIPQETVRATGGDYSSDYAGEVDGWNQPGSTAGTRVACSNPDPNQVPNQNIINSLNRLCLDLDIYVQITYNGGKTSRASGTKNHPAGHAADFQVVDNGAIIRPKDDRDLYEGIVARLLQNAKSQGVRPGIGGYPGFIHYDESDWRQGFQSQNALKAACGHWNSGFHITNILLAALQ